LILIAKFFFSHPTQSQVETEQVQGMGRTSTIWIWKHVPRKHIPQSSFI